MSLLKKKKKLEYAHHNSYKSKITAFETSCREIDWYKHRKAPVVNEPIKFTLHTVYLAFDYQSDKTLFQNFQLKYYHQTIICSSKKSNCENQKVFRTQIVFSEIGFQQNFNGTFLNLQTTNKNIKFSWRYIFHHWIPKQISDNLLSQKYGLGTTNNMKNTVYRLNFTKIFVN